MYRRMTFIALSVVCLAATGCLGELLSAPMQPADLDAHEESAPAPSQPDDAHADEDGVAEPTSPDDDQVRSMPLALTDTAYRAPVVPRSAAGDTLQVTFGELPRGVRFDPERQEISGTPEEEGMFVFGLGVSSSGTDPSETTQYHRLTVFSAETHAYVPLPTGYCDCLYQAQQTLGGEPLAIIDPAALPPGLEFDPEQAVLTGMPEMGTYSFLGTPVEGARRPILTLEVLCADESATIPLPPARVGERYTLPIAPSVDGEPVNVVWSLTRGALPPGLYLRSWGGIEGIPVCPGTYVFEPFDRCWSANPMVVNRYELTVEQGDIVRGGPVHELPPGFVGTAYDVELLTFAGNRDEARWVLTSEAPPGLTLDPETGRLSGRPTVAGCYSLSVEDYYPPKAEWGWGYAIRIEEPLGPTTTLPGATVGCPVSVPLGPDSDLSEWRLVVGQLPPGVTLDPDSGTLEGVPTAGNGWTYTFALEATSVAGAVERFAYRWPLTPQSTFRLDLGRRQQAFLGRHFRLQLPRPDPAARGWRVMEGRLPDGITLDPDTGVIEGTPTSRLSEAFRLAIRLGDCELAQSYDDRFRLRVNCIAPEPEILESTIVGHEYLNSLAVRKPAPEYLVGTLPPGLVLTRAGVLKGKATEAGDYTFYCAQRDWPEDCGLIYYREYRIRVFPD